MNIITCQFTEWSEFISYKNKEWGWYTSSKGLFYLSNTTKQHRQQCEFSINDIMTYRVTTLLIINHFNTLNWISVVLVAAVFDTPGVTTIWVTNMYYVCNRIAYSMKPSHKTLKQTQTTKTLCIPRFDIVRIFILHCLVHFLFYFESLVFLCVVNNLLPLFILIPALVTYGFQLCLVVIIPCVCIWVLFSVVFVWSLCLSLSVMNFFFFQPCIVFAFLCMVNKFIGLAHGSVYLGPTATDICRATR